MGWNPVVIIPTYPVAANPVRPTAEHPLIINQQARLGIPTQNHHATVCFGVMVVEGTENGRSVFWCRLYGLPFVHRRHSTFVLVSHSTH